MNASNHIAGVLFGLRLLGLLLLVGANAAQAQNASLFLTSNVPQAEVLINGQQRGQTDHAGKFYASNITPGSHVITVRKTGWVSEERVLTFSAGLTARVSVTLAQSSPPPEKRVEGLGNVLIDANVGGAEVYLDDAFVGRTKMDGKLMVATRSGLHVIRVQRNPDFMPQVQQVEVASGELTTRVPFDLQRAGRGGILAILSGNEGLIIGLSLLLFLVAGGVFWFIWDSTSRNTRRFDQYEILRVLGRGGMSTVYLAKDKKLGETVALKIMESSLMSDQDLVKKFLREGEVLERIYEWNPKAPVVRAYRYGRENGSANGRLFLAMEYVPGLDLAQYLQKYGRLPVKKVLLIARAISEGLSAAHGRAIWHRDVTPDNIIIKASNPTLSIKLIDFGVAKHEYTSAKTLDGGIFGKPPYMSPEQCSGGKIDGRSDVYSLGIMMYALLTGKPPFMDRHNPLRVMWMHQYESVPPLPEHIHHGFRQLIYTMLEKQPEDRLDIEGVIAEIDLLVQSMSTSRA